MITTINTHRAYKEFRLERTTQLKTGKVDIDLLVDTLHRWSTNPDYTKLVKNRTKAVNKMLSAGVYDG